MNELTTINEKTIQNRIYTIRSLQVMIDSDLAELYGVETRALNQAVKRNIERFPQEFMFQLTQDELENWKSQIVISNKELMGLRKMPFAFTEQGVSMLSAVLKSQTAIQISIKIINSFVQMRRFMLQNASLFQRIERLETDQKTTNEKLDNVLDALENKSLTPKQGIFYNWQIFDSYIFAGDLIKSAKNSIVLIDNYIDESVFKIQKRGTGDAWEIAVNEK